MFDLGIQELIVIFVVALLVFGPKKLPELGRSLGKGIAELKKAMQGVKEQMDAEMRDIKDPLKETLTLNPGNPGAPGDPGTSGASSPQSKEDEPQQEVAQGEPAAPAPDSTAPAEGKKRKKSRGTTA